MKKTLHTRTIIYFGGKTKLIQDAEPLIWKTVANIILIIYKISKTVANKINIYLGMKSYFQ